MVIGFGHPVYTVSDPRNVVIKKVAEDLSKEQAAPRCSTSPSDWNR